MAQAKKSKKKKFSASKVKEFAEKPKKYEYFLMLEKEASVVAIIDYLKEKGMTGLDVWEAMGVFSLEPNPNAGVDFEQIDIAETFVDPSDVAFIKNRSIQTVFSFEASDEEVNGLKPYLKEISEEFGGFTCGDSDDFQPMVAY